MSFCPNCGVSIDSQVTECPNCGYSLKNENAAPAQAERRAPRIIGEEPLSQQSTYAPPVQQPVYHNPPLSTHPQPPVQSAYQQPLQQYPPSMYQQQPYAAPAYVQPKSKKGGGAMAMAIMGGVMAVVGSFLLWYMDVGWVSNFIGVQDIDNNEYLYAWLIPLFGLLAMIFGILSFATQKKSFGAITTVFGFIALLITIILPLHMSFDSGDLFDILFIREGGYIFIYIGGFAAMTGGILAMMGGFILSRKLTPVRRPSRQQYQ